MSTRGRAEVSFDDAIEDTARLGTRARGYLIQTG
jgi:hypothetical protein